MEVIYTANFQPDLVFSGLRIGEPIVTLTSLVVSAVCFYNWNRLKKMDTSEPSIRLARIFFLLLSLSTLLGSLIGHAFIYQLPFAWKLPGWTIGMIAVSAMQQASIVRYQKQSGLQYGKWFTWFNTLGLVAGLWLVSATLWFPSVEIHSALGFLGTVLPIEMYLWLKHQNRGSKYILAGIATLIVAVIVHILKYSLGIWFSFFDIGHLFMCVALFFFLRGFETPSVFTIPYKNSAQ